MHRSVGFLLFVILSVYVERAQSKPTPENARSYCDVIEERSLIRFNFSRLSLSKNDHVIKNENVGDSIRLRLCGPLQQQCDGMDDYSVCLTKNGKEIGLGKGPPHSVIADSGKVVFKFVGDSCKDNELYSTNVVMRCKNEAGYDSQPQMLPHVSDNCSYVFVWENKAACGSESMINCTTIRNSTGEHYDLGSLTLRSENYVIIGANKSATILNVCHSVVNNDNVSCSEKSGSCFREVDQNQRYIYRNLGEVHDPPYFDEKSKELILEYDAGEICRKVHDRGHVRTVISFICDHQATNTQPEYVRDDNMCTHRITWRTAAACSIESMKNQSLIRRLATAGTCKVTNPRTNYEYNLHELMNRDFHAKTTNGTEYAFQICGSVSDGSCPSGAGACIVKSNTSKGSPNLNLSWSQGGPYLNYTNGVECDKYHRRHNTLIGFFCGAEGSPSVPIIIKDEYCSLTIHWNTPLVCDKKTNCETKNGEFNLASLIRSSENYVVKANDTEFEINVCRPLVPKSRLICLHGSAACQVRPKANGQFTNEISLGYPDGEPFFDDNKNVILRYEGGSSCPEDGRYTISSNLTFLCDYTAAIGSPRYKFYQNCTYSFEWSTSIICDTAEGRWTDSCTILNPHLSHKVNLTSLREKTVYSVKSQSGDDYNISICDGDTYCKGSTVCRGDTGYGTSSTVIFDYNRNVIKVKFSNGTRCKTGLYSSEVHFICDESSGNGQPRLISEYSCSVVFEWRTKVVCVNHTADQVPIVVETKTTEMMENIEDSATWHVGTSVGIAILIGCCMALIIYLWSSERRARLRFCFYSLTSRREHCRAQYTKVNATEEARLLLDITDTTQCVTDSDSDDELLDA